VTNQTATSRVVDITPDPSLLPKSGQVNYKIPDAVGELVDNAVDARIAGTPLTVEVYIGQRDGGTVQVSDDGSGMSTAAAADAMRMGYSAKVANEIGKFGLGLKTACTNLGRRFEIVTCRSEDETAHRIVYDEEAFIAAGRWEIAVEEVDKPFDHGTVITITLPRVSIYGGVDDVVATYLGRIFKHFIRTDQAEIVVNGTPVDAAEADLEEGPEPFEFEVNGKKVAGWIGYQRVFTPKGGYGFDLIRRSRVVMRHEKIGFNPHTKYNKIVGEVVLDDFEVINNKTDFVRDTDDWRKFVEKMAEIVRPLALQAGRKYGTKLAADDTVRVAAIEDKFETAVKSEEFARSLDRQLLSDVIAGELAPAEVEKRKPRGERTEAEDDGVIDLEREARERQPRTPKETREVLRRTRLKLLDINIEHVPVKFGPDSIYKTWELVGLGTTKRLVVSSNLDHPMFSHMNDTITWIKHNIAEALAEFLSQHGGIEDVIKTKSDILRFVAELEIAEEEEEEARVS
jgi:hypothetical protein